MLNKIVSLLVFLCVVAVLIWGSLSPENSLFFFISSNKWISIGRLLIAGSLVWISFRDVINTSEVKKLSLQAGLALMGLGTFLFFLTQYQSALFDYFKPLDLVLMIEAGVIFSLTSLTTTPASAPKAKKSRQLALPFKLKTATKVFSIT
jgi:hypothetical protein